MHLHLTVWNIYATLAVTTITCFLVADVKCSLYELFILFRCQCYMHLISVCVKCGLYKWRNNAVLLWDAGIYLGMLFTRVNHIAEYLPQCLIYWFMINFSYKFVLYNNNFGP